jgi:DNA-binding beta-propeller fold protein YncE
MDARARWLRVGRMVLGASLLTAGFVAGCGDDDDAQVEPTPVPEAGPPIETGPGVDTGTPPIPTGSPGVLTAIAMGSNPFDATLSKDGKTVFFTGTDKTTGITGVFSVDITDPTKPGAQKLLSTGTALIAPFGIAVSADDTTLFVADPAAGTVDGVGVVFSLPASGGAPTAIAGTAGLSPRGLEVAGDQLYIVGRGGDGMAGLFKVGVAGGTMSTIAKGAPFDEPNSVAVTRDGTTQYVLDATGGSGRTAALIKVSGGAASVFVDSVKVGFPPGVSLTPDETTVLVSALDSSALTDAIFAIKVADKTITTSPLTAKISNFSSSAGLHCSRTQLKCVWADSTANGGTVFLLSN